jgi:ketosteroid isomerase-like protein
MKSLLCLALSLASLLSYSQSDVDLKIRKVNSDYVSSWLNNDKEGILSLFEKTAMLSPSGLRPVKGIKDIEQFWFPNDSSVTTIHTFTNEILNLSIDGDLAHSTQKTFLSWSYVKGGTTIKKDQWGIALTVYRRQADNSWKIWRQLWTDVKAVDRN